MVSPEIADFHVLWLRTSQQDIEKYFEIAASGVSDAIQRYGIYKDGWSFQSKAVVTQLQTADIWAYENYRYATDRFFAPEGQRRELRQSYKVLRTKVPHIVRYMNEKSLRDLVSKARGDKRNRKHSFDA